MFLCWRPNSRFINRLEISVDKIEFINQLRIALNGRVPATVITENCNYYEEYINTQVRLGHTQEEVLQSLGDPRLIARTIIETQGIDKEQGIEPGREGQSGQKHHGNQYTSFEQAQQTRKMPKWVWLVIVIAIVVCVLGLFISVISFFAPLFLVFFVIFFFIKLFRDWLK